MYPVVPRTILFREEHSKRTLVPKVEFISAAGNPQALLTGKALFSWQKDRRRFRLESVHPGHALDEIRRETGFDFDFQEVNTTQEPSGEELALLRGPVATAIRADYPDFAKRVWG
jgi:glutaconate CoA-transferase, subunit B